MFDPLFTNIHLTNETFSVISPTGLPEEIEGSGNEVGRRMVELRDRLETFEGKSRTPQH